MPTNTILKPHPAVVFTPLSDHEAVLLHMESKLYYSLNRMGHYMWQLLDHEMIDAGQLANRLTQQYGISEKQATDDVSSFLKNLRSESLIQDVERE